MSATNLRAGALAILLSLTLASAQIYNVEGRRQAAAAACSPASGGLLTETFNPTGYDLSWTEVIGSGGSPVVDEDNTNATILAASSCVATQLLRSYAGTSSARAARAYSNFSATDPAYARVYVYVDAETMANSQTRNIVAFTDQTPTTPDTGASTKIHLSQDAGGALLFELRDGNTTVDSVAATIDTWYRLELKNDNGTGIEWKVCLAGASTCDSEGTGGTDPAFTAARLHLGQDALTGTGADVYFDHAVVCSGGFCGE